MKKSDFILESIKIVDTRIERTFSDGSYDLLYELRSLLRIILEIELDLELFPEQFLDLKSLPDTVLELESAEDFKLESILITTRTRGFNIYKFYNDNILDEFPYTGLFQKECLELGCYRNLPKKHHN